MNYSRQRELVYNVLKGTRRHPTAETIYLELKKDYPLLSLATVYRNLNQMCTVGMIKRLRILNSSDRYDATTALHHHLSCSKCQHVVDIEPTDHFADYCKKAFAASAHRIDAYEVLLFGVCRVCLDDDVV